MGVISTSRETGFWAAGSTQDAGNFVCVGACATLGGLEHVVTWNVYWAPG